MGDFSSGPAVKPLCFPRRRHTFDPCSVTQPKTKIKKKKKKKRDDTGKGSGKKKGKERKHSQRPWQRYLSA